MSDLKWKEKGKFEELFGMASGYVLDFSDRTFQEFVLDSVGVDIGCDKYNYNSGSKANRLRSFWTQESNYLVAILNLDLIEYRRSLCTDRFPSLHDDDEVLVAECEKIGNNLKEQSSGDNLSAINSISDSRNFSLISSAVRESLRKNQPEAALDRLHTLLTNYIRDLCDKNSISFENATPLHSLFGGYMKTLKDKGAIESVMTERILKSSISVLEAFNAVRNKHSFAHDNPPLSHSESKLIVANILSLIEFIHSLSEDERRNDKTNSEEFSDDIPF